MRPFNTDQERLIHLYLDGEMDENERVQFDQRLNQEEVLKTRLEEIRAMRVKHLHQDQEAIDMLSTLAGFEQKQHVETEKLDDKGSNAPEDIMPPAPGKPQQPSYFLNAPIGVSLAVIALLIIGAWFFLWDGTNDSVQGVPKEFLAEKNFFIKAPSTKLGAPNEELKVMFEKKDFDEIIAQYDTVTSFSLINNEGYLYYVFALIKTRAFSKAFTKLDRLKTEDSDFEEFIGAGREFNKHLYTTYAKLAIMNNKHELAQQTLLKAVEKELLTEDERGKILSEMKSE